MISSKIKGDFLYYQSNGQKESVVNLLKKSLMTEDYTDEDRCWAYWNISDNLAMLRWADDEYKNHKLFEKQILSMDPKYIHWLVSDATQKLTLIKGGYEEYWNELYLHACNETEKSVDNQRIRFESHRATVATPAAEKYSFDKDVSLLALDNIKKMLVEFAENEDYLFYKLTYYTLKIGLNSLLNMTSDETIEKSLPLVNHLLPNLKSVHDESKFLLGSWQDFNARRSKYNQAEAGIGNYIIQLINASRYQKALECYQLIKPYDITYGSYFDKKINFAQQQINQNQS